MKSLLIILVFLPLIGIGQCKYEKNEIDEFTGKTNKQTKWERIASKNVMAVVVQLDDMIGLLIAGDIGCVNNNSSAYFKFQDDSVIQLAHLGQIDCGSIVSLILPLDDENLQLLATKPIAKIRLVGTERNLDVPLSNPNYFINVLENCFNVAELISN